MRSLRLFCLFSFLLLSGCATHTVHYSVLTAPSAGKAVVYIYRVDHFATMEGLAPNLRINYRNLGALIRQGYFRVEVNPGSAQVAIFKLDEGDGIFWPVDRDVFVNLELKPDNTYFVELALTTTTLSFKETSREVALQSIPGMHLLN